MRDFEAIVIGGGGVGSSTAYHLSRAGISTLLLEQFDFGHDRGSSHGESRIIRYSYRYPQYVRLAARSYELWKELENEAAEKLIIETGGLDLGDKNSQELNQCIESLNGESIAHRILQADQIRSRFPQFEISDNTIGLWQANAGILSPDKCLRVIQSLAREEGASLIDNCKTEAIERNNCTIKVLTTKGSFNCSKLIITPGAWMPGFFSQLVCEDDRPVLSVSQEQYAFFETASTAESFSTGDFPLFIQYPDDKRPVLYGFPNLGNEGVKLAEHHGGKITTAENRSMDPDPELLEQLRQRVALLLPTLGGSIKRAKTCLYTNTADQHFIVDFAPGTSDIIIGAGFSGHGFKFIVAVGKILSDLAIKGNSEQDLSLFKLSRFRNKSDHSLE